MKLQYYSRSTMAETRKDLKNEAERQILRVTIPGSGVVTKSGMEKEEVVDDSD